MIVVGTFTLYQPAAEYPAREITSPEAGTTVADCIAQPSFNIMRCCAIPGPAASKSPAVSPIVNTVLLCIVIKRGSPKDTAIFKVRNFYPNPFQRFGIDQRSDLPPHCVDKQVICLRHRSAQ